MPDSILKTAVAILGGALLVCLGGIIYLAGANPARAIPDVLVATTGLVSGGLVGILVPTKSASRNDLGRVDLAYALVVGILAVVLLILVLSFAR